MEEFDDKHTVLSIKCKAIKAGWSRFGKVIDRPTMGKNPFAKSKFLSNALGSYHFDNETFEIAGFGHCEEDRMIHRLPTSLKDTEPFSAGLRRHQKNLPEDLIVYMVGAGA